VIINSTYDTPSAFVRARGDSSQVTLIQSYIPFTTPIFGLASAVSAL